MIKIAFKVYAVVSILAPWVFALSRWFGLYNRPGCNSWIFLGLFLYSGLVMFMTFRNWDDD